MLPLERVEEDELLVRLVPEEADVRDALDCEEVRCGCDTVLLVERVVVAVERVVLAPVERLAVALVERVVDAVERVVVDAPVERVVVAVERVVDAPVERLFTFVLPYVRLLILRSVTAVLRVSFPAPTVRTLRTVLVARISRAFVIPLLRRSNERSGCATA